MLNTICQISIAILSPISIWLVGSKNNHKKWGYIVGLSSQPFWLYTSYNTEQWGTLFVTICCTLAWTRGIYNHYKVEGELNLH